MKAKYKLFLYFLLFFMALNFASFDSLFAQGINKGDVPFPEEPGGNTDYWQQGYNYAIKGLL